MNKKLCDDCKMVDKVCKKNCKVGALDRYVNVTYNLKKKGFK